MISDNPVSTTRNAIERPPPKRTKTSQETILIESAPKMDFLFEFTGMTKKSMPPIIAIIGSVSEMLRSELILFFKDPHKCCYCYDKRTN